MGTKDELGTYTTLRGSRDSSRNASEDPLDQDGSTIVLHSKRSKTFMNSLIVPTLLVLLLLSITQISLLTLRRGTSKTLSSMSAITNPCGSTAHEARSRGCKFDLGLAKWLPPQCYNHELDSAYLSNYFQPFEFYRALDSDRSKPDLNRRILTIEELSRTNGDVLYSTWRYHMTHCMHAVKYIHAAAKEGRRLPGSICGIEHTEHCERIVLNGTVDLDAVGEGVKVGMPDCVPLDMAC
ncbi:hypothetical protein BU26DRAFT_276589 [Trematosphaeria pertusa]|uniref:Uncharacterized protein n=1 Tax=Trematosphaeria pertusa TaxID=390896 RepID=A0A6A6ILN5_9PLEO|nr:uncharacterized protein BU26DRAFT_276589 [Trematosphaeria pertusa]KAF2251129.1 hypothetical protein BU26DRAFT_276589 [Trematosphaeria pertusa]